MKLEHTKFVGQSANKGNKVNTENIMFGKLPREAQLKLISAWLDGNAIESKSIHLHQWIEVGQPCWFPNAFYRVKPNIEYPSINWDHVHKDYNYLAIDATGIAYLYPIKPTTNLSTWVLPVDNVKIAKAKPFSSFKPGNCDWRESLISRPGY